MKQSTYVLYLYLPPSSVYEPSPEPFPMFRRQHFRTRQIITLCRRRPSDVVTAKTVSRRNSSVQSEFLIKHNARRYLEQTIASAVETSFTRPIHLSQSSEPNCPPSRGVAPAGTHVAKHQPRRALPMRIRLELLFPPSLSCQLRLSRKQNA